MLPAVFSETDCKLVLRYCAEFPGLWDRLNSFLWLEPEYRPRQAVRFLKTLIREEWLEYGLSHEEIDDLFVLKRKMLNLDRKLRPQPLDPLKTKIRIWVYDMPTVLLGKNRADGAIDQSEFLDLQTIAGDIIFAAPQFKQNRRALECLLNENTPEDRWVRDLERLLLLDSVSNKSRHSTEHSLEACWEKLRPTWQSIDALELSRNFRH